MEGKLIKTSIDSYHNGHYFLNDSDGFAIGSTNKDWCKRAVSKRPLYILSLKNCETIENGYDLIKLIEENSKYSEEDWGDGFLFAMNLMSDKKFDEFLDREKELGISDIKTIERIQWYYKTYFNKSQQTEWLVNIEMECPECKEYGYVSECRNNCNQKFLQPKLDADGCLILKRK